MLRRLVTILAAALLWVLAGCVSASGKTPDVTPGAGAVHIYACDSPIYDAPGTDCASERGPPAYASSDTTYDAVGRWSRGTSRRSDSSLARLISTIACHGTPGQAVRPTPKTGVQLLVAARHVSSLPRSQLAANGVPARFIGNSAGDILDTTRITIPEGKFGYLLKNPSKSGVFKDSMGFDEAGLDTALRGHLTKYFGGASESAPMTGGGSKFVVRGPMTGPSGQAWDITTAWGVDLDGTVRLITATP